MPPTPPPPSSCAEAGAVISMVVAIRAKRIVGVMRNLLSSEPGPTAFGGVRHVSQRIPRPMRPLPGLASAARAAGVPTRASVAATRGAAKLVPRSTSHPPPGTAPTMSAPGAA
ncbi:hypothetical protein WR25_20330 [Diploscapter pachys]|uniref:Uncharacterized protein n=1 Tax=Diploscapter pachys TaxID=2018661 RepID=A0A2A2M5C6_9BILA|nr:hypothetical protein WR25_20330 [Diploscapter pachys]